MHDSSLEPVNIIIILNILNFALVGVALWILISVKRIGGLAGKALTIMAWGLVLLGVAHLSDTILAEFQLFPGMIVEVIHRIIVLFAAVLLALGSKKITAVQ